MKPNSPPETPVSPSEKTLALSVALLAIERSPEAKAMKATLAGSLMDAFDHLEPGTPCRACAYFSEDEEAAYCRKWDSDIPPEAQGEGCEAFCEGAPF